MKEGPDLWWEPMMARFILGKHSLSDQHVEQAAQSPLQDDFARGAIFMGLPLSQLGQQLHLSPVPTDAKSIEGLLYFFE